MNVYIFQDLIELSKSFINVQLFSIVHTVVQQILKVSSGYGRCQISVAELIMFLTLRLIHY